MLKKIAIEKISELAAELMGKGNLIAPVKEAFGHNFAQILDPQKVDLDYYNTLMSPKSVFFPHKEDFVKYRVGKPLSEAEQILLNLQPTFLFGVRPCDVKSFEIMDIHFNAAGIIDPYWSCRVLIVTVLTFVMIRYLLKEQGAESGMPACLLILRWRRAAIIPELRFISACGRKYLINIHTM